MSRKIVRDAIATGAVVVLGAGIANAQSNDIKKDTLTKDITDAQYNGTEVTIMENYSPVKSLKQNQSYKLHNPDSYYTDDPYYSINGINQLLDLYKGGFLISDKKGMDTKEIKYFESLAIPGLSEYSTQRKDIELMDVIVQSLNNKCLGEDVGVLTQKEMTEIYTAMEKAGYSELKFLVHKHYDEQMKIVTYKSSQGKVRQDTLTLPAKDVLEAYKLEDIAKCDNGKDTKVPGLEQRSRHALRPYIEANLLNSNLNKMLIEYGIDPKLFMPELGFGLKLGRFGLGVNGAYSKVKGTGRVTFLNGPGNGYTIDSSNVQGDFICIGAKASFDIAKAVSLCLGVQNNYFDNMIRGGVAQSTTDRVVRLDDAFPKMPEKHKGSYITYSAGGMINVGKNKNYSIPFDARFTNKGFEGADIGFRYTFGNK